MVTLSNYIWYAKKTCKLFSDVFIWYFFFVVTDVLWIDETLFAAVYCSFDEGDTPKFKLISAPVSRNFCTGCIYTTLHVHYGMAVIHVHYFSCEAKA